MKTEKDFQWCNSTLNYKRTEQPVVLGAMACYLYKIPGIPLHVALNNVGFILPNGRVITEVSKKPRQAAVIVLIVAK